MLLTIGVTGTTTGTTTHISIHKFNGNLISGLNVACLLTSHFIFSDILHPSRPNVSKDELRNKLATLYKAQKDQVSVFGLRTQFGGGKTTGFGLVYDSPEALKKFEPQYRQIRYGLATKVERASRQQRTFYFPFSTFLSSTGQITAVGYWRNLGDRLLLVSVTEY